MRAHRLIAGAGCVAVLAWSAHAAAAVAAPTRIALPAGVLALSDSDVPAGSGATVTFTVQLHRSVGDGRLALTLPRLWMQRSPVSGLAYARLPARGRASSARAKASRLERVVRFDFANARKPDSASFDVRDVGIPAGTYRLAYTWREGDRVRARGSLRVRFSAPLRER